MILFAQNSQNILKYDLEANNISCFLKCSTILRSYLFSVAFIAEIRFLFWRVSPPEKYPYWGQLYTRYGPTLITVVFPNGIYVAKLRRAARDCHAQHRRPLTILQAPATHIIAVVCRADNDISYLCCRHV